MKNTCIVCGGEEFFSSTLYARTKQDWAYAPNMYRFEKVFIEHRDEENYPVFQKLQRNIVVDAVILCCITNEHTKYNLVCFLKADKASG